MGPELTDALAGDLAGIALGHVEREYPNKLDHVLDGPDDALGPRALHPIFYGSFDWHSCVHGYWMLARLLRRRPRNPCADAIRALFARRLTPEAVSGECAYLRRASARGFERPYGWGWLLLLDGELAALGGAHATALQPLAEMFADRFLEFLPRADYPVRTGSHGSTAFALRLALASREGRKPELGRLLVETSLAYFGNDRDARPFEPSGDDFLSPTLMEAELMRTVLDPDAFRTWIAGFLPGLLEGRPETLFTPAVCRDRSDGKIAHLDGLNLSRAWCLKGLASAFGAEGAPLEAAAERHLAAALPHLSGEYMGEHWLASFALLALDGLGA